MKAKACLTATRGGAAARSQVDRNRLALILQGKRLGFTLSEIRELLACRRTGGESSADQPPQMCIDQINLLERQRRDIDQAIAELRQIYTEMLTDPASAGPARLPGTR